MDSQRPSPQPISTGTSSTPSGSSSSVPSLSTISTEDPFKLPLSTSPSGRVSFVFPHSRNSPRLAPKAAPLVELPTVADVLPLANSPPTGDSARTVVLNPNRLRLISDDELSSILGPAKSQASSMYRQDRSNVQEWVASSKRASSQGTDDQPHQGGAA